MSGIQIVFGSAAFGSRPHSKVKDAASAQPFLDALERHGITTIDTAQLYQGSEEILGQASAGDKFILDTKDPGGFMPDRAATSDAIRKDLEGSLAKLKAKQVDVFYIHAPPDETKSELGSWLPGVDALHKQGAFKRFGLSNFPIELVRKVHGHCKSNGYVLPTVYQGNYSAVARKQETLLFPGLRELGISFYAYSPIAGGFLTKTKEQIQQGAGRFDASQPIGKLYAGMYNKPSYLDALAKWEAIAKREGCPRAELAYRWVRFNSPLSREHGDAIIVGASSVQQLEETLKGLENGPLSDEAVRGIDDVWKTIEHEAPVDNYAG